MPEINLGRVVGPGVQPGGATGSILTKSSAADYDTAWVNLSQIGAELVKTTNPVGAALSQKVDGRDVLIGPKVIHVAKTGSDDIGNGSEAAPYLTIQHAINSMPSIVIGREKIFIHEGDYDEDVFINAFLCSETFWIEGFAGETVRVKQINLYHNALAVYVRNIEFFENNSNTSLQISTCILANIYNCKLRGNTGDYGAILLESTGSVFIENTDISNSKIAINVTGTALYLNETVTGTSNTVAIRCGGYGSFGGFAQKGGSTIAGEEQTAYGGQIF